MKLLIDKLVKKKNDRFTQMILAGVLIFIVVIFVIVGISHHKKNEDLKTVKNNQNDSASIEPFQKIAQFNQSATGQAISDLQTSESLEEKKIKKLEKKNKALSEKLSSLDSSTNASESISRSETSEIPLSSPASDSIPQNASPINAPPRVINASSDALGESPVIQNQNMNSIQGDQNTNPNTTAGVGISDFTFSYGDNNDDERNIDICSPKNCILPGTFARAVMIGAADANASVNGQSNTTPILFRILSRGVLPNGYHSHLKGCFVVGEVYGDISSERGEVKLSQISCVIKGQTISKSINGTAYFLGKEGIRGRAIMRNGPMLWNAGVAGMLSGLAQGVEQAQQTQSISPLGTTSTVNSDRIAASMGAGGIQSAANTLATYYVKRANQYHPVIELNAGTIVDLVFLNKFLLMPTHQSSGSKVSGGQSNSYWSNKSNQANSGGDINSLSYGQNVSSSQENSIQNQINQAG